MTDTPPGPVVVPGVDVVVGWKVATNGVWAGVGNFTGTLSTASDPEGAPSSTVVTPVAAITWEAPAWTVPVQRVEPVDVAVASTQHGAVAVTFTVYELVPTG